MRSTDASISALISLAALDERCARLRTSPATTAKPRPSSPARAASTAAFSARMLVWNAIPSMIAMMSAIFAELSLISPIVPTTWPTTVLPLFAISDAFAASELACRALSAFCFTVPVNCSMLDAVSCNADACSSVRDDRSMLPAAICRAAVAIDSLPPRTVRTVSTKPRCIRARPSSNWPISSRRCTTIERRKSPAAIASKCASASASGRPIARLSVSHDSAAATRPATSTTIDSTRSVSYTDSARSKRACASLNWKLRSASPETESSLYSVWSCLAPSPMRSWSPVAIVLPNASQLRCNACRFAATSCASRSSSGPRGSARYFCHHTSDCARIARLRSTAAAESAEPASSAARSSARRSRAAYISAAATLTALGIWFVKISRVASFERVIPYTPSTPISPSSTARNAIVRPMRARIVRFPITIILPVLRRHERAGPAFRNSVSP
ncbi:hypothetical protein BamMEX5DRAFT_6990 [Burkholderia ambifaria MEX-5]|uniref:Uncharacterized protein n=1 Tax=Burkholderia ambifaria MEX-5 TaxID=396597 RepID=B1TGS4_9BURK|nr:hypothetical protein BamMEX5DRAFT_6990 [Burkholderia ambifaria MEX-5]